MNSTRKWLQFAAAVVGTVVFGGAAFAWACTENANISAFPKSGVGGSKPIIDGAGFTDGPVELRWDGINGRLLAIADGPKFQTHVTIPESAELGVHKIVAVHINAMHGDDGIGYTTAAFTVVAPEAPVPARENAPDRQPQPAAEPNARPEPARAGVSFAAHEPAAASDRAVVTAAEKPGTSQEGVTSGPNRIPPVTERTAFGDATGGFSTAAAPSLIEGAGAAVAAGESRNSIALGLALLALGFAALLGGGLAVVLGRRHAPAVTENREHS